MVQKIGLDNNTAGPTVTLLSSNLNTSLTSAATSSVDFGSPSPLEIGYEVKLDCQALADDQAYLEIMWSHDNSDFSDPLNAEIVVGIECTPSVIVPKSGSFSLKSRYAKFQLRNRSAGTINSASTALLLFDTFGDIT